MMIDAKSCCLIAVGTCGLVGCHATRLAPVADAKTVASHRQNISDQLQRDMERLEASHVLDGQADRDIMFALHSADGFTQHLPMPLLVRAEQLRAVGTDFCRALVESMCVTSEPVFRSLWLREYSALLGLPQEASAARESTEILRRLVSNSPLDQIESRIDGLAGDPDIKFRVAAAPCYVQFALHFPARTTTINAKIREAIGRATGNERLLWIAAFEAINNAKEPLN